MRIGIDIRTLENNAQHRGIGRYATNLIENISQIDHSNTYIFICSSPSATIPSFSLHKDFRYEYAPLNTTSIREKRFVGIFFVTRKKESLDKLNLDCALQLDISYPLKFNRTPVASVLYDLIPLIFRDIYQKVTLKKLSPKEVVSYFRQKAFWYFSNKQIRQYMKSAAIVSISKHSAEDLKKYLPEVDSRKIKVTYLSATKLPDPDKPAYKNFRALGLGKSPYIVYVGGLDPRKGLEGLVRDFSMVHNSMPEIKLVLGGKEFDDNKVIEAQQLNNLISQLGLGAGVVKCHRLSDELMHLLYKNALAAVLPSRYEGFGLPALDPMLTGCPVICYNNSSLPEVVGDAAILVQDGAPMHEYILQLAKDIKLRKVLSKKGLVQASKFSWSKTAQQTIDILEGIAK